MAQPAGGPASPPADTPDSPLPAGQPAVQPAARVRPRAVTPQMPLLHHSWADVPSVLHLSGPDRGGAERWVLGCYTLEVGQAVRGMPLWSSGPRRLYFGEGGFWCFARDEECLARGTGDVFSCSAHSSKLPQEVDLWQVGLGDSCGYRVDEGISVSAVPEALQFVAPDKGGNERLVVGCYALLPGLLHGAGSMPVWGSSGRRLYSSNAGFWAFARDGDSFTKQVGDAFSVEEHRGRLPHQMDGLWQIGLGGDAGYRRDPAARVRDIPSVLVLSAPSGLAASALGWYRICRPPPGAPEFYWLPVWARGHWRIAVNEQGRWSLRNPSATVALDMLYASHEGPAQLPHDITSWHRRYRLNDTGDDHEDYVLDPAVTVTRMTWKCRACSVENVCTQVCAVCGCSAPHNLEPTPAHPEGAAPGQGAAPAAGASRLPAAEGGRQLESPWGSPPFPEGGGSPAPPSGAAAAAAAAAVAPDDPAAAAGAAAAAGPAAQCVVCQERFHRSSGITCDMGHWCCAECAMGQVATCVAWDNRASFAKDGGVACPVRHGAQGGPQRLPPQRIAALASPKLWQMYERAVADCTALELRREHRDELSRVLDAVLTPQTRASLLSAHVHDRLLDLPCVSCPACGAPFDSFADCFALPCGSCDAKFCAYCHVISDSLPAVKRHIASGSCPMTAELGVDGQNAVFPDDEHRAHFWARAQLARTRRKLMDLLGRMIPAERVTLIDRLVPGIRNAKRYAEANGVDLVAESWDEELLAVADCPDDERALHASLAAYCASIQPVSAPGHFTAVVAASAPLELEHSPAIAAPD